MLDTIQYVLGALSGALVGFSLGLVGGGGSMLAVPLMVYLVGVPSPHIAIGTSALAVATNAATGLVSHAREHTVKWRCGGMYAAAGIVSELKRLAVPASVDSIPSSAMQEDHVSMGWSAARKLRRAIDGLGRVLAVELITGSRALDLRAPLQPGAATGAARDLVRTSVAGPGPDHFISPDIEAVTAMVQDGSFARIVREHTTTI